MAPLRSAGLLILSLVLGGGPARLAQELAAQHIKADKAKALTKAVYDIRDLVAKPTIVGMSGRPFRAAEPAQKALGIVAQFRQLSIR